MINENNRLTSFWMSWIWLWDTFSSLNWVNGINAFRSISLSRFTLRSRPTMFSGRSCGSWLNCSPEQLTNSLWQLHSNGHGWLSVTSSSRLSKSRQEREYSFIGIEVPAQNISILTCLNERRCRRWGPSGWLLWIVLTSIVANHGALIDRLVVIIIFHAVIILLV